jgi:cytoplasmic FMR1 interacting protein
MFQYFPQSVEMGLSTISNPVSFADFKGYQSNFGTEVELTSVLEAAIDQGQEFVWSLYAYRSVSKAIPEVVIETPEGAKPEDEAEIALRRSEINRKIVDILRGGMAQMKEVKTYVTSVVGIFHRCVSHLAQSTSAESAAAEGLYLLLIRLLDLLVKLDNLKDMKASVLNDFARYKRALGAKMSSENVEEVTLLQSFLSSFDVKKSKNFIFSTLRDEVKRVRGHEDVLQEVLDHCLQYLDHKLYMHAEEKFRLIRVMPYLLLLLDGNDDEPKSYNVFTGKKYKSLPQVQKYIKHNPVVPVCGDMSLTLGHVLELTRHFERDTMASAWGTSASHSESSANIRSPNPGDNKIAADHSLLTHWKAIRQCHTEMTVRLAASLNRLQVYPFEKLMSNVSIEQAADAYEVTLNALRAIADWNTKLFQMISWKYAHPCSLHQLAELGIANTTGEGLEYEQVIRYNLGKEEIYVIVDVVSLIKSLSSQLSAAETTLAPLIRYHIHHSIQQLVQGDLLPILHRVDKRNKSNQLSVLLAIRHLAADWTNKTDPGENYKAYSRKQGSVIAVHNPRVVSTTHTQLHLLRMFIYSVYDDSSAMRQRNGLLGKADLEKEDIKMFETFYVNSYFYPYMLSLSDSIRNVSDVSDLWYKEFYLELTKCIQFPIEMSIPWILTEQIIVSNRSGDVSIPIVENVLFTLDIYNDAAYKALYILCQQYLYDEIEAEANLVLDQIIFLLSDELYLYTKETVSSNLIDQPLRKKLEEIKGEIHLQVTKRRLFLPASQRNVQLLGRSINLNFLIGQHVNGKFQKDLEVALKKFESADVRGLPELVTMLQILRNTHNVLSSIIELDPFDSILGEIDESVSPTSHNGRIFTHISRSICYDLIPNFCYNMYTQRFVKAPFPLRPLEYEKAPKTAAVHALFGVHEFKAHEMSLRLSKNFFGKVHMESMFQLAGYCDIAQLINYLLECLKVKLDDIVAYMEALRGGIPPCKMPQYKYKTGGVYGYFVG